MFERLSRWQKSGVARHQKFVGMQTMDNETTLDITAEFEELPDQIISDHNKIVQMLTELQRQKQRFNLSSRRLQQASHSYLLAIDGERLLLRQPGNDAEYAALCEDGHINVSTEYRASPLFFTLDLAEEQNVDGKPCFSALLPPWLLFSQMRQTLRVYLPEKLQSILEAPAIKQFGTAARIVDISESGVGFCLELPQQAASKLQIGDLWPGTQLLTAAGKLGEVSLKLRHCRSDNKGVLHVGAAIEAASEAVRQSLRRLVLQQQRSLTTVRP